MWIDNVEFLSLFCYPMARILYSWEYWRFKNLAILLLNRQDKCWRNLKRVCNMIYNALTLFGWPLFYILSEYKFHILYNAFICIS